MDISINSSSGLSLQRLMTWLSPAFPVGAFAYSAGLEVAIDDGRVRTAASLKDWIEGALRFGSMANDAIFVAEAYRREQDAARLAELTDLCRALCPSAQRVREMETLGNAFIDAASAWPSEVSGRLPRPSVYPVAVGAVAGAHNAGLSGTLIAFLTAYAQSQVSVAIRLVPLGHTEGLRVLAGLEPLIAECAGQTLNKTVEDVGSISYAADIAAMAHETLTSRIFRS